MAGEIVADFSRRFPQGLLIHAQDLRFRCDTARITVLFGPSGAGKTTVLRCLAGLDCPDAGSIRCGDQVWFDQARSICLPPWRRNIGYLAQDGALFPHLDVVRNIAFGLRELPSEARAARVEETIRLLNLNGLESRLPQQLSGGEQQRVALARAVARRPQLLLLDEPLSALDLPARTRLRTELRWLLLQFGIPVLVVTHDRVESLALGDDLIVIDRGQIAQRGSVEEVFSRPSSVDVAGIVLVETIQPARVIRFEDGLLTVAVGETRLSALVSNLPPDVMDVFVCIRAEDVIVLGSDATRASPRNQLPATVTSLVQEGPMVRLSLNCGFPLTALLTKQACVELNLKPGDKVVALIKAPQIHVIPR